MPKKGAVVVPVGAAYGMQFAKLCWFPTSFVVPFTDSRTDRFLYNASWFCCHTFRKVGQPLAASSLQIPHARAGAFWVAKIGLSDTMKFDHFNFQARNMRQCGTRKLRLAHAFLSYLDVTLPLPTPPHICSLHHAHSSPGLAAITHHVPLLGGVGFFSLPHQSLAPSGTRRPPPTLAQRAVFAQSPARPSPFLFVRISRCTTGLHVYILIELRVLLGCICISSAYDARGTTPVPTVRGVSPSAKIGTVFRPCFWDRFLIWKSKSNVWILAIDQPRLHRYEMAGVAICSSALRKRRTHLLQKSNGRYRQTL